MQDTITSPDHSFPAIITYAIYFNPSDFPNKYVLRKWRGLVPDMFCVVKDTLDEIHKELPPGLFPLGQDPIDKTIIEVWI